MHALLHLLAELSSLGRVDKMANWRKSERSFGNERREGSCFRVSLYRSKFFM